MMSIDDYAWLTSPEGLSEWRAIAMATKPLNHRQTRAGSKSLSPHRLNLLTEQWRFAQGKAREKVEDTSRWFWSRKLLEQASDEWTANETALDAPSVCNRWLDVCCGAGVDSVAMAKRHSRVIAVDSDPIAICLARGNAAMNEIDVQFQTGMAESLPFDGSEYLNIDPDRRHEANRTIDPRNSRPAWSWIAQAVVKCKSVSLKLAPGLRVDETFDWCGAPKPSSRRWLSWEGMVRQQRWYWGIDRWPSDVIVASCGSRSRGWHHEIFSTQSTISQWDALLMHEDLTQGVPGFVADQDPVVRAAGVSHLLAERLGATCIGDRNGYFFRESPVFHPMLRWFRVLDVLAIDSRRIRNMARYCSAAHWELKTRGVDIDTEGLQRQLHRDPSSGRRLTILFTRMGKKRFALVAERIEGENG